MSLPNRSQSSPHWQMLQWIVRPLEVLEAGAQQHGDCFTLNVGNVVEFVMVSNPQGIEQILTENPQCFEVGRSNRILQRTLGDHSILLLDGDRHQRQRQLLMPPFHGERMKAYGELIQRITQGVMQAWQPGETVRVRSAMQSVSLRVILQAVFGIYEGERVAQLQRDIENFLEFSTSRLSFLSLLVPFLQKDLGAWSLGGRFVRLRDKIDQQLYAEIRERQTLPDASGTDILSLLMAARDVQGQAMTAEELRDELMTLLIAGHETTATAMSWALYWIHRNPEVKQKLIAEIDALGENPEPNAIVKLPYLNAVCSETLRLYPVAILAMPRITKSEYDLLGYHFPADTWLTPCIYLTHHREDLYPEPKQFKPERFLERQFSPYEYLPFGGSNRRCIGAAFALFEMKLALAEILANFELTLASDRPVVPIRRGITMAPKGGVEIRILGKRTRKSAVTV